MSDLVPVEPFRQAFLESGLGAYEVARRLGWETPRSDRDGLFPDSTRLKRALGLAQTTSNGRKYFRKRMFYEQALEISRALDADPVDLGL